MGPFTMIPVWLIQDVLVLLAAAATIVFIVRHEAHPETFLMELFAFSLLYAAVYENFATLMGWYGYGRSILMVFNVPLTVPLVEYLVVYSALRLADRMQIPTWTKPILAGVSGILFDLSLDPLSVRQVFAGREAAIGRWSWFPRPGDITLLGIPVYNFSGWMLLCGYAAAAFLLGRYWFRRSGFKPWVGILYPILAMLAALIVMVSPISMFLLWLGPFLDKGGLSEWIMLAAHLASGVLVLAVFWRGRMRAAVSLRGDWPIFMTLIGFHIPNIVLALVGGYYEILPIQIAAAAVQTFMVVFIYLRGNKINLKPST